MTEGPIALSDTDSDVTFRVTENYEAEDDVVIEINNVFTVDKSTLAVRENRMDYTMPDSLSYEGGFTVTYDGEKRGEDVMKAWDKLRTVTVDIKTETGERTETFRVPDGWFLELLPDEGITVYADEALTDMTYNYIGSGTGDITLYARDEANTVSAKADPSTVTLENVIAVNYLTSLIKQYGQVKVHTDDQYLTEDACYFRGGTSVAHLSEWQSKGDSATGTTGSDGVLSYQINEDGSVTAYDYPSFNDENYKHDDYVEQNTDGDGEYFEGNTFLFGKLLGGKLDELAETDAGYSFRVTVAGSSPTVYRCTVDKVTLALRELRDESGEYAITVEYGEDLTPFAAEYADAMKKNRTLTYHAVSFVHTYDYVYTVPAGWSFYLGASDMTFYANADFTGEVENLVPADGKDYEFWVSDGTHTLTAPSLPFTMEQFIAANSISALVEKYGQVFVRRTTNDGSITDESEFFRSGDTPVMHETFQNPYLTGPQRIGTIGNDIRKELRYEIDPDGQIHAGIYLYSEDEIDFWRIENGGEEKYRYDGYLVGNISSIEPTLVSETDDTVTFSVPPAVFSGGDAPPRLVYTADKKTFAILSLKTPDEEYEVVCGENAAPFASKYATAMTDSRTVTCHYMTFGETYDLVFRIPSAWDVSFYMSMPTPEEEPNYYADAGWMQPVDPVIPANSGDVEIWATPVQG